MDLDMSFAYSEFVTARHAVWEARQLGLEQASWTRNTIVRERKFTNVFRVLDAGSQYVGTELLTPELTERERLYRAFLYRHTGRPEPWDWFNLMFGRYPLPQDVEDVLEAWKIYRGPVTTPRPDGTRYTRSVFGNAYQISDQRSLIQSWQEYRGGTRHVTRGKRGNSSTDSIAFDRSVFTGAYLVFPQSQTPGTDKLDSILLLAARLFTEGYQDDIMPSWEAASSQRERFAVLRRNKGVGDFMSMQILTDMGYTTEDREDEFVVPGPGCIKGAKALAPSWSVERTLNWAHAELGQLGISIALPDGRRRAPSMMDAQNTLCEFSKYVRFMERPPTGSQYRPAHHGPQPAPWLPPLW